MKGENINDRDLRRIYINQPELNFFCNNSVKTAKYNIFTFIPLAIFYQFNNYFNIFFLITAVILSIKIISPMDPAVAIFPFVFVLSVSIIREAIEDFKKAQFDKTYNNSKVKVINSENKEEVIKWSEVRVGNIIKIEKNDIIASDVLILKTSDKNNIAFMQTTNLDGENSLKQKEGLSVLTSLIEKNNGKLNLIRGIIEIDQPNSNIYKTNGKISINDQKYIFTNDNILLRSATLKNIDLVYGIVVYTGKDTKIMNNNNQKFSLKISSIERTLNKVIIAVIIVVFSICVACTVFGMIFMGTNAPNIKTHELKAEYIYYSQNNENPYSLEFFKLFGSFFIIFNNIIPISLTITFEIAKGIQVSVMEKDKKMKKDNENFKALSLKIQEDLGNVRYIFTDKTGTLTKNELEFKACSVINRIFYNTNKQKINSKNEKLKEETNTKHKFNICDAGIKNENLDENNNKKIKKSMFSDDFPILSLKQALVYDFPINFNVLDGIHENISNNDNLEKNSYELKYNPQRQKEDSKIYNKKDVQYINIDYKENVDVKGFKEENIDDTSDHNKFNLNIIRSPIVSDYRINKNTNYKIQDVKSYETENEFLGIKHEYIKQTPQSPQVENIFENKSNVEDESQSNNSINYIQKNYNLKCNNFLQNSLYTDSSKELIKEFFINIALNHNVLLNFEENQINYQGPNPDEVTLTTCSYEIGIKFLEKNSNNNTVKLEILGEEYEFEVLFKAPFQSATKRSSIVVREINKNKYTNLTDDNPNDIVKIYIKGADNVIFDLIDENSKKFILPNTKEHLDLFAKDGLRTLCYTVKYITSEDFQNWKSNYNILINQAIEGSNEAEINLLIRELEKNSILLGVTGLEDKLQHKVKETINDFIEARIHMWMLTGDNIDTAESIGHSSQIFNDDTEVFKLKASESKEELKAKLKGIIEELENMNKVITRLKLERKKKNQKSKLKTNSNNNKINKNNKQIENNSILSIKRIKVKNNSSKNIPIFKKSQYSNEFKSTKRTRKMSKFSNVIDSENDLDKQILEKDKNNSDDEFSRNKNGKYVNKILNIRENQQEGSTIRKLDSLYLNVTIQFYLFLF